MGWSTKSKRLLISEILLVETNERGSACKMSLILFMPAISLLFILFAIAVTNYCIDIVFAFHQNYPEFDSENKVKNLYEILKNAPNFKYKIIQLENMTDFISIGCGLNMVMSLDLPKSEAVNANLDICDEDVAAMKAECDTHYDVMAYCKDKSEFMINYMADRNLNEEPVGKVASASPE
jgi:hypothetical protein